MKDALAIEEERMSAERKRIAALRALREAKSIDVKVARKGRPRDATMWLDDVREMIVKNDKRFFTLGELDYDELGKRHPNCNTVEAHTRHILQVLRDLGEVVFVGDDGTYIYLPFERAGKIK